MGSDGSVSRIIALSNGSYVVLSPRMGSSGIGAVTWSNGLVNGSGTVSSTNSLTDSSLADNTTRITELSNGNYVVSKSDWNNGALLNAGQVRIVTPQNINFNNGVGQTMTFSPSMLQDTLGRGTSVTLQASNDITWNAGANLAVTGTTGGFLTLQAGRNIILNSSIFTANGNFTAVAGDAGANIADRDAGTPTLTLGMGATINAGTGKVTLAANGGNFVNNTGSATPITAAQWWVYSTKASLNAANSMNIQTGVSEQSSQSYTGTVPAYAATGNWFLYSEIVKTLTITPTAQTLTYGTAPATFSYTLSGFLTGDDATNIGLSGTALFNIGGSKSGSNNYTFGTHEVSYLSGLSNTAGYAFLDAVSSLNELIVNKLDLAVTGATASNKTYNGLNNATVTGGNGVSYSGFVNSETSGVLGGLLAYGGNAQGAIEAGSYFITPSGLSANNYEISYKNGSLVINPQAQIPPATPETPQPVVEAATVQLPFAPVSEFKLARLLPKAIALETQGYNLEPQIMPLQVSTTQNGKPRQQREVADMFWEKEGDFQDSDSKIEMVKGGINLGGMIIGKVGKRAAEAAD